MRKIENWLYVRAELLWGLISGVFIGLLIALFPIWRNASLEKNWWEIATAVGTVGTVALGVLLATSEARRNRRIARLKAKSIVPMVVLAVVRLRTLARDWGSNSVLLMNDEDRKLQLESVAALRTMLNLEDALSLSYGPRSGIDAFLKGRLALDSLYGALQLKGSWTWRDNCIDSAKEASKCFEVAGRDFGEI